MQQLSSGYGFTCVRNGVGVVSCWGDGTRGQLGDGLATSGPSPGPVTSLSDAVDIASEDALTCAVRRGGSVVCWGNGYVGGGAGYALFTTPSTASNLTDAVQVSVSTPNDGVHTGTSACAVRRAGGVVCWGENFSGQLGDDSMMTRTVPTPVLGLP